MASPSAVRETRRLSKSPPFRTLATSASHASRAGGSNSAASGSWGASLPAPAVVEALEALEVMSPLVAPIAARFQWPSYHPAASRIFIPFCASIDPAMHSNAFPGKPASVPEPGPGPMQLSAHRWPVTWMPASAGMTLRGHRLTRD